MSTRNDGNLDAPYAGLLGFDGELEVPERFFDEVFPDFNAQEFADPAVPQDDLFFLSRLGVDIDQALRGLPPELREEGGGHQRRLRREPDVRPPLEPVGGIRLEPGRLPGQADRNRVETGALDENILGVFGDRGQLSADHARQGHRPGIIRDDQHVREQSQVRAVEAEEALALPGTPDDDLAAADLLKVEGVDRLGGGKQHIVRHVDDIVDRVEPHGRDPLPEPVGRRPDPDALDDETAVPQAEVLVRDLDVDGVPGHDGKLGQRPGAAA